MMRSRGYKAESQARGVRSNRSAIRGTPRGPEGTQSPTEAGGIGREARRALTVLEVLVVVSIIGMVMALLLPAVHQSRAAARRTQCANNLRNLGLAMLAAAEANRRFPASGHYGADGQPYHNWVVSLLAWLERADIAREWQFDKPVHTATNAALADTQINLLICPADDSVERGHGNLSYVVNHGVGFMMPPGLPATYRSASSPMPGQQPFDLNGNGTLAFTAAAMRRDCCPTDRDYLYRLGMFFGQRWPDTIVTNSTPLFHTTNTVFDGLSQTIVLSENVRAGYDAAYNTNWSTPDPWRCGFFVSGYICDDASCAKGKVHYARANARSGGPWIYEAIGAALSQAEGQAPWPSSGHVGGVHVAFADGHVRFLSQDIEGSVYVSLVSPQGMAVEGPLTQRLLEDSQY